MCVYVGVYVGFHLNFILYFTRTSSLHLAKMKENKIEKQNQGVGAILLIRSHDFVIGAGLRS